MTLKREKALVAAGLLVLLPVLFGAVGSWALRHPTNPPGWLVTFFDTWVPLLPASVWVYASWYPVTALPVFLDRNRFRRMYRAYVGAFGICLLGYVLLPITITRPELAGFDGTSVAMLRLLYAIDPPVNLFPSFHAAVAMIVLRVVPTGRWSTLLLTSWTLALLSACVLTRQHYILDVVAGAGLGLGAVACMDRWARQPFSTDAMARSAGVVS